MKQLRNYQTELSLKGIEILNKYGLVYLAMQVRCGKTATALEIAKLGGFKNVLFLTKKKAIKSIEEDFKDFGYNNYFNLFVINDESMHKITDTDFDIVIHDEHHRLGSFSKPSKSTKLFKEKFGKLPLIFLSGTPHPESYSQLYHQLWVKENFWKPEFSTFYKFAKKYVNIAEKNLGYARVKDYSKFNNEGLKLAEKINNLLFIRYTQEQASFKTSVNKNIIYCEIKEELKTNIKKLIKDKFIEIGDEEIIADTAVKLQNKVHQMYSGSVITEVGNYIILDYSKAEFIKEYFKEKKIAIFYYFKSEFKILKTVFGDMLTDNLEDFNTSDKNIALQQVSGAEGISLAKAEFLIFYNFGFSNVKFTQSIDRLTTMDRKTNDVYFIFSKGGIEEKIYRTLDQKKDYILSAFKRDYGISK